MRALTTIASLVVIPLRCLASDDYPIHVYPAPEAKPAPRLDGILDDPCWQSAPLVGGFSLYNEPTKPEVQTFFRVAWDARALYLAVECDEPQMSKVAVAARPRDAHEVFGDEAIEVFIDPTHDHSHYYQFGVSVAGSLYDSEIQNATWNSDAEVETRLGGANWTVEAAIPWKDLVGADPGPGAVIGFNVCRDRYVGPTRGWTNWSQTNANFHDPERFGHVVLSPTPEQLGKLGMGFRQGGRTGPLIIFSTEGFSGATYAALAKEAFTRLDELLGQLERTQQEERDPEAARLLGDLIGQHRQNAAAVRASIADQQHMDAAAWSRVDVALQKLERTLGEMIWQARLSALLSGI